MTITTQNQEMDVVLHVRLKQDLFARRGTTIFMHAVSPYAATVYLKPLWRNVTTLTTSITMVAVPIVK